MNNITKLLFGICAAVAAMPVASAAPDDQGNRAADVSRLVQSWQPRLIAAGMTADDARSWTVRNMGRFARLNDERLALAQRAESLSELELVLMDAPLGAGSPLGAVMANPLGGLTMMGARNATKSSPATSPSAYAGMVFTALTPCRILDSRPSQGGTGAWIGGSSNLIKIGPYSTAGGGYKTGPGAQGGSATSCGLDALAGPGQVAVIMAAVSTVSQAGPGYLTFYPQGAPNPGATSVSQWYQPGYVQTSFVLIPSDLVGTVAAQGFTSVATDVIIDIVGYFAPEPSEAAVTSITAGTGLSGGTITSTGTIAIATPYQLPQTCTNGQVAQSNGAGVWSCATSSSYTAGTGLSLVGSTFAIAGSYQLPQTCANGQVAQSNGAGGWTCLTPASSSGTVTSVATGSGLTGGPITGSGTISLAATQLLPTVACAASQVPQWSGSAWTCASELAIASGSTTFVNAGNAATLVTGSGNTGIGTNALLNNTTGGGNTASGAGALQGNTTGVQNTATGQQALAANTSGTANTATGWQALTSNTTGGSNTASGMFALAGNTTGGSNVATGFDALFGNTIASDNTAVGANALHSNTTAGKNTAVGSGALFTQSFDNGGAAWDALSTAVGYHALFSNNSLNTATGLHNTGIGANALAGNTTGNLNTALGKDALAINSTGGGNTATGAGALQANTTGNGNTALGQGALFGNTTGAQNVGVGFSTLVSNLSGSGNIALGYSAGAATTGNLNIVIGTSGVSGESNTIRLGDALNHTRTFVAGIRGVTTGVADAIPVVIDSNGQLGTAPNTASGGTVTSVATGSGLTGGPITTTGTIGLAATQLLPTVACATNEIPKWSGSAWGCAADATSAGTVTGVTASAPLASSGGTAPNISLTGTIPVGNGGTGQTTFPVDAILYGLGSGAIGSTAGTTGQVLTATAGAPVWTGSPALAGSLSMSGNLVLGNSTATTGNIIKGIDPFLHNFGSNSTFLGVLAGNFTMTGFDNTGIGEAAMQSIGAGLRNAALGTSALQFNTSGVANVAIGWRALRANTSGSQNTAVGLGALLSQAFDPGTAWLSDNTALGFAALAANAPSATNNGIQNTAVGSQALGSNSTGSQNTATGYSALFASTTGNFNVANGMNSLLNNTTGSQNVALGVSALNANVGGNANTAVGNIALINTTGSNNVALGFNAGGSLTSGSFNIDIGNAGVAAEGNTIRIGDGNQTRAFISGIRGVTTGSATGVAVLIDANGQLGTVSSSRRFKDGIADMDDASDALMKLRPVTFRYKSDASSTLQYGLIAEEVAEVYPGLVARSNDGQVETVMYQFLPPMLLNEVQKQQRTIASQAAQIAGMAAEIAELKKQAARLASLFELQRTAAAR